MMSHQRRLKKKSRSITRPRMVAELVVTSTEPGSLRGCFGTSLEPELAQSLQQLETQVGQQRAVIEHQQEQLMRQQTTIHAERAARTPVIPIAQDARVNLVDLRVGKKPETFAGETHENEKKREQKQNKKKRKWKETQAKEKTRKNEKKRKNSKK